MSYIHNKYEWNEIPGPNIKELEITELYTRGDFRSQIYVGE